MESQVTRSCLGYKIWRHKWHEAKQCSACFLYLSLKIYNKFRITIENVWINDVLIYESLAHIFRAVARIFVTGEHYRKCRRHEPCRLVWGSSETLFSALVMGCLWKVNLEYENGKQLQVTIIKVTESKENKSIHRLDVSGSIGPGGGSCLPLTPPPPLR